MSDRLSAYIEKRLLKRLGCTGRQFAIERCHAGAHTETYYLNVSGFEPLVLKIFENRQRFRQAAACMLHLAGLHIPVPRIMHMDEDGRLLSRGFHVLCEERIAGQSLEQLPRTSDIITRVAKLYAGLHAHQHGAWGDFDSCRMNGLYGYLQKKTEERLNGWSRAEELPAAVREKILKKLAAGRAAVESIKTFSLSHTDPNRNNIMLRESDGELVLLDTGSIRYLPRAIDYFMLQAYFCFDNPSHAALFEKTYFSGMSQPELAAFNETRDFFRLYVIVLFVHDLTTRFAALDPASPYYGEFKGLIPLAKNALTEMVEARAEA